LLASKPSQLDAAFGSCPAFGESTGLDAEGNSKESPAFESRVASSFDAEIHWYEATGIGRMEFIETGSR